MLVVMLVCVGAWMRLGKSYPHRIIVVVVLGIVAVGATTLTGSIPPITDYPMSQDQALRVYPPTAFPFTLQQHRDYDAGLLMQWRSCLKSSYRRSNIRYLSRSYRACSLSKSEWLRPANESLRNCSYRVRPSKRALVDSLQGFRR